MNKKGAFFSILIPVYNVEKYLLECLNSVLQQDYHNYEIIIIDDGSTDKSIEIIKNTCKANNKIKYYMQENQGLILTRRSLLKHAQGDYILFLDSDDYLEKNTLSYLNSKIEKYHTDLLIFKYKRFGVEKTKEATGVFSHDTIFHKGNKKELVERMVSSSDLNNLVCKVFKKELVDLETDYSDYKRLNNGEDLLQSIPIIFAAEKIIYLDKAFYNYRMNEDSITSKLNLNFFYDVTNVRKKLLEYIKNNKLDDRKILLKFKSFYLDSILEFLIVLENSNISDSDKKMHIKEIKNDIFFKEMSNKFSLKNIRLKNKLTFIILKNDFTYDLKILENYLYAINLAIKTKKKLKSKFKK